MLVYQRVSFSLEGAIIALESYGFARFSKGPKIGEVAAQHGPNMGPSMCPTRPNIEPTWAQHTPNMRPT